MTSNSTPIKLDRCRSIWAFRLEIGGSEENGIQEALSQSMIYIRRGGDIDWSDEKFDDPEKVKKVCRGVNPHLHDDIFLDIAEPVQFRCKLEVGDYVIITSSQTSLRAFGRVAGKYEFDTTAGDSRHRRKVEWIRCDSVGKNRHQAAFYPNIFGRQRSIRKLNTNKINWNGLETFLTNWDSKCSSAHGGSGASLV